MAKTYTSRRPIGWSPTPRQCLLCALAGALASTVIVTAVSFLLRPAHLRFSVADARSGVTSDRGVCLNLTLVATNPSGRAAAEYETLDVMLWYGATEYILPNTSVVGPDASAAAAAVAPLLLQPPRSATAVEVTAHTLDERWLQEFAGNRSSTPFNVVVAAQVRFRVGPVYTRPYNVRVSCTSVDFFAKNQTFTPVECQG